jgi:hypothetical protein
MWRRLDNQEVGLEAATLKRKRNSSLVKRLRADNVTGLKSDAEAAECVYTLVGEHSNRSEVVLRGTVDRLEETLPARVAIKSVRCRLAENLRFPWEG